MDPAGQHEKGIYFLLAFTWEGHSFIGKMKQKPGDCTISEAVRDR